MFYKKLTIANMKTALLCMAMALTLTACGGGESNSNGTGTVTGGVFGCGSLEPAPGNTLTNDFCNEFWIKDNMQNVCANCHKETNPPFFMAGKDSGDINLAAQALLQPASSGDVDFAGQLIVDLANPSQSYIVKKMQNNHNCWASPTVCADIVLGYIENWAGDSAGGRTIQLTAPLNANPPGGGKQFPATATTPTGQPGYTFEELIYNPILIPYCSGCHKPNSNPQGPLFADPANLASSYEVAKSRIDLDDPGSSRLAVKLPTENHNCWEVDMPNISVDFPTFNPANYPGFASGDDCADNAAIIEDAITKFAEGIPTNAVDPNVFLISRATSIPDGIVASGGSRYEAQQIALYEFKTGQGTVAYDTSGAGQALDLQLQGPVNWVGGWGISIDGSGAMARSGASNSKLYSMIQTTGQYSIEAWVAPNNVTQEMARIVNYTGGGGNKNFALSQTLYNYDSQVRNTNTGLDGEAALSTPDAEEVLQATLQHVVTTYDTVNGRQIYVNGELKASGDILAQGGSLSNWNDSYTLVLGNESGAVNDNNLWKGVLKLVSIHNSALSQAQIQQNYNAGVGEKFFLLFDISHIAGVPTQSYIMFTVSQFDNYSYLFTDPKYVSLNSSIVNVNIPIKGMRIGINSNPAAAGQAYLNMDMTISTNGQSLSPIGTTVALQGGPDTDEFYLIFEALGTESRTYAQPTYPPRTVSNLPAASDIGLKTFDEINTTFSAMLGISTQTGNIPAVYNLVKQQLPSSEDVKTFVTAHNIGATQLAMEYCNQLVTQEVASPNIFSSAVLNQNATADPSGYIDPILALANGSGMDTQMDVGTFATGGTVPDANPTGPDTTFTTKSELVYLVNKLNSCIPGTCSDDATQTRELIKAVCTATLSSANSIIQ